MSMLQSHQIETTVGTLLQDIVDAEALSKPLAAQSVSDLTLDSRQAGEGALFAAMPGHTRDGRQFVQQAVSAGVSAILFEDDNAPADCRVLERDGRALAVPGLSSQLSMIASRFFSHPSRKMKVIGVTGTNGKTTCATMLQQALSALNVPCAVMGTLGASFEEQEFASGLTTADAITVQRQLHGFLTGGAEAVCMEVSSHGLDQGRVSAVDFNVAILTNLTQDHLDYHLTMQAYGEAKKKLFDFESLDAMVVNRDDLLGQEILAEDHSCTVISYGMSDADVVPLEASFSEQGIEFNLEWCGKTVRLIAPVLGRINLPNLLAISATLLALGFELERIQRVFSKLSPPPGRMERFSGKFDTPAVVVDYSHTPDSLARAINDLSEVVKGRLWVVFGCGGDRDRGKRAQMGRVAERGADRVILTNDNPRNEDPAVITADILDGMEEPASNVSVILDRRNAITHAIQNASHDDVVLVAGKGHEPDQVIGDKIIPFSDRQVVLELLEGTK